MTKRVIKTRRWAAANRKLELLKSYRFRLTLVDILLGIGLGDGNDTILLGSRWVSSVRSPNGFLQELIGVLLLNHHSESFEDISSVVNQDSTLWGELLDVDGGVLDGILESRVHLLVVWHSTSSVSSQSLFEAQRGETHPSLKALMTPQSFIFR